MWQWKHDVDNSLLKLNKKSSEAIYVVVVICKGLDTMQFQESSICSYIGLEGSISFNFHFE